MLPHHPPEVGHGVGQGTLGSHVGIGVVVALVGGGRGKGLGHDRREGLMRGQVLSHCCTSVYVRDTVSARVAQLFTSSECKHNHFLCIKLLGRTQMANELL